MLTQNSSVLAHWTQNIVLIVLSIICLPISNVVLLSTYALKILRKLQNRDGSREAYFRREENLDSTYGLPKEKTILLTGLSMTKSLTLMRLLSQHTPYKIIGADTSRLCPGRFSIHCHKFRRLASPDSRGGVSAYKASLLNVIREENVGLWVSCSGVMSAVDDAEVQEQLGRSGGNCQSIQFGVEATKMLHEKELFIRWLRDNGFTVPITHDVLSREAVLEHLYQSEKQGEDHTEETRFILKPTGVIDAFRADMTLLPLDSYAATRNHIDRLPINPDTPWILQEFIQGQEFCTHALIVEGKVRNFVACPSSELLMHYEALPVKGRLSRAMLDFTEKVAGSLQKNEQDAGRNFTGHLSFDFLVKDADLENTTSELRLYPIECNPRVHTAVALFRQTPETVEGFIDVMQNAANGEHEADVGKDDSNIIFPSNPVSTYWIAHDLLELLLLPLLRILTFNASLGEFLGCFMAFFDHVTHWRDGAFDVDDPLPAWWLYQVYWPAMFASSIISGKRWSRVNVSTTKMFGLE